MVLSADQVRGKLMLGSSKESSSGAERRQNLRPEWDPCFSSQASCKATEEELEARRKGMSSKHRIRVPPEMIQKWEPTFGGNQDSPSSDQENEGAYPPECPPSSVGGIGSKTYAQMKQLNDAFLGHKSVAKARMEHGSPASSMSTLLRSRNQTAKAISPRNNAGGQAVKELSTDKLQHDVEGHESCEQGGYVVREGLPEQEDKQEAAADDVSEGSQLTAGGIAERFEDENPVDERVQKRDDTINGAFGRQDAQLSPPSLMAILESIKGFSSEHERLRADLEDFRRTTDGAITSLQEEMQNLVRIVKAVAEHTLSGRVAEAEAEAARQKKTVDPPPHVLGAEGLGAMRTETAAVTDQPKQWPPPEPSPLETSKSIMPKDGMSAAEEQGKGEPPWGRGGGGDWSTGKPSEVRPLYGLQQRLPPPPLPLYAASLIPERASASFAYAEGGLNAAAAAAEEEEEKGLAPGLEPSQQRQQQQQRKGVLASAPQQQKQHPSTATTTPPAAALLSQPSSSRDTKDSAQLPAAENHPPSGSRMNPDEPVRSPTTQVLPPDRPLAAWKPPALTMPQDMMADSQDREPLPTTSSSPAGSPSGTQPPRSVAAPAPNAPCRLSSLVKPSSLTARAPSLPPLTLPESAASAAATTTTLSSRPPPQEALHHPCASLRTNTATFLRSLSTPSDRGAPASSSPAADSPSPKLLLGQKALYKANSPGTATAMLPSSLPSSPSVLVASSQAYFGAWPFQRTLPPHLPPAPPASPTQTTAPAAILDDVWMSRPRGWEDRIVGHLGSTAPATRNSPSSSPSKLPGRSGVGTGVASGSGSQPDKLRVGGGPSRAAEPFVRAGGTLGPGSPSSPTTTSLVRFGAGPEYLIPRGWAAADSGLHRGSVGKSLTTDALPARPDKLSTHRRSVSSSVFFKGVSFG